MAISKLFGSQAPLAPPGSSLEPTSPLLFWGSLVLKVILAPVPLYKSSHCSTLVALYLTQPHPRPCCPCSWSPLTYPSLQEPFHSTWPQGFLSRTSFTFSSLNVVLGERENAFMLWSLSGKGVFCLALRAGMGVGRKFRTGGHPAWSCPRKLIRSALWNGRVRGQNLRTESLGVRAWPSPHRLLSSDLPSERPAPTSFGGGGRACTVGLLAHELSVCEAGETPLLAGELQTDVPSRCTNQEQGAPPSSLLGAAPSLSIPDCRAQPHQVRAMCLTTFLSLM